MPVLGWWLLLEADYATWLRAAVVAIGTFIIGIAPFQIGHPWNWIIDLYTSTAAYYHETSVNAFNFVALDRRASPAGFRHHPWRHFILHSWDGAAGAAVCLRRRMCCGARAMRRRFSIPRSSRCSDFSCSRPRMHERYLYPALVFVIPLALESTEMMVVFAVLIATCLFNLAYIKHTLESAGGLSRSRTTASRCSPRP